MSDIGAPFRGSPLRLRVCSTSARYGRKGETNRGKGPIHCERRLVRHCGRWDGIIPQDLLAEGYLPVEYRPAGIRVFDIELAVELFGAAPQIAQPETHVA